MLSELAVRGLGVIDELSLMFDRGMTALTGETGAGKTMVVEAIDLLTGGRADAALVRSGAPEAEIEGRFTTGEDEVVLRRVIPRRGRSRAYVDGHLATVSTLAELSAGLVDLHGQHAHQSLLSGAVQRACLDRFGGVDTAVLAGLVDDQRAVDSQLSETGGDARARAREIDLLNYQLAEIDNAAIRGPDEDEHLAQAEALLADAAANRAAANRVVTLLNADGPASEALGQAQAELSGRGLFAELADRIDSVAAETADIAATARVVAESIDEDPAGPAELGERRRLLAQLRRKYGSDLSEVLGFRADAARRLSELEGHGDRVAALERRRSEIAAGLAAERRRVLGERRAAAPRLADAVQSRLAELAMAASRLEVAVQGDAGERVAFLLAANPGSDPLPLARAASGGELARVMLALRLVLTEGPPTLVFDEVDAGIGGAAALAVGRSLAAVAEIHQVLVVTHLPQVAAHAHCQVTVEKSHSSASASATARRLTGEDRLVELSRMLSGSPQSAAARRHAAELLASAADGHKG